jgi:hypothetical protein
MRGLLAGIGGQFLLPKPDPAGFKPFCIIRRHHFFCAGADPFDPRRSQGPSGRRQSRQTEQTYRDSPLGVVAEFLGRVTTGAFLTLGPIFAERWGLSAGEIAIFMACGTLGGFVVSSRIATTVAS